MACRFGALSDPIAALKHMLRASLGATMVSPARKDLTVDDLGDLPGKPLVAVLATCARMGTIQLSPVYHEWREGAFNVRSSSRMSGLGTCGAIPGATVLAAESGRCGRPAYQGWRAPA
jgi:hypothetical protein